MNMTKAVMIERLSRSDVTQIVEDPITKEKLSLRRFICFADRRSPASVNQVYQSVFST